MNVPIVDTYKKSGKHQLKPAQESRKIPSEACLFENEDPEMTTCSIEIIPPHRTASRSPGWPPDSVDWSDYHDDFDVFVVSGETRYKFSVNLVEWLFEFTKFINSGESFRSEILLHSGVPYESWRNGEYISIRFWENLSRKDVTFDLTEDKALDLHRLLKTTLVDAIRAARGEETAKRYVDSYTLNSDKAAS